MTPVLPKKTYRSDIPARKPGDMASPSANGGYPAAPQDEARRLVVGPGIHLQGNVSSCAHLVVEGRIDATLLTAQRMDVLIGGQFTGTAEVQEAVISGRVEGKLTVAGRLLLRPSARVTGELRYGSLQIEAGAQLNGSLAPIGADMAIVASEQEPQGRKAHLSPVPVSNVEILFAESARPADAAPASDDDDLFARREAPGGYRRAGSTT